MKTLTKLTIFVVCLLQVSTGFSFFQDEKQPETLEKHYINFDKLVFSEKGAFLKGENDVLYALKELRCDSEGYFFTGFFEDLIRETFKSGNYEATCQNCGEVFENRAPSPCPNCDYKDTMEVTEFDPETGSYWDRA